MAVRLALECLMLQIPGPEPLPPFTVAIEVVHVADCQVVWAGDAEWWNGDLLRRDPRFHEVPGGEGDFEGSVSVLDAVGLNKRFGASVPDWQIPDVLDLESRLRRFADGQHAVQISVMARLGRA